MSFFLRFEHQHGVDKVFEWCGKNALEINTNKTEHL